MTLLDIEERRGRILFYKSLDVKLRRWEGLELVDRKILLIFLKNLR
jgi:hypothetical protein